MGSALVRTLSVMMVLAMMPAGEGWAKPKAPPLVIAAFGDSLTAGYGVAPEDAFPVRLEKKLTQARYNVKVINDGVSGDTTAGGVARVDYVLAQHPDLVILELGANDMLRGTPPRETRANLDAVLDRLHQAQIPVVIAGMKAPLSYGMAYTTTYNPMFCDLAKTYGDACYSFFLEGAYGSPTLMQEDGIHPNKVGVDVIIGHMLPMIMKVLKDITPKA